MKPRTRISLLLLLTTAVAFGHVLHHDFVLYDDGLYITDNLQVQSGITWKGISWAFTSTHASNWHPITWLSHMLDCQIYGISPYGHHLTSLILHLANTILLFLVLNRATGGLWRSAFVAALFGLHPLHVESVAWVAERKDVLSTFFWMLTMWFYVRYVASPRLASYVLVVFFMALGLMAKPMLVTLPFVLLLMDFWPLRRLAVVPEDNAFDSKNGESKTKNKNKAQLLRLFVEKIPLLVLAAVSSVITIAAQQSGKAFAPLHALSLKIRLANALVSYVKYIAKMLWPQDLACLYTYPYNGLPAWQVAGAAVLLLSVSGLAIRAARRFPYVPAGWFWYLGTLIPVIGLVQVGSQSMADRYTYVPLIGLFIVISWGVAEFVRSWRYGKAVLAIAAGIALSGLTISTWLQVGYWRNSTTLFQHTLRVSPDSAIVQNNLGFAFAQQGRLKVAVSHYREALRIEPYYLKARFNLGFALGKLGRLDEAIDNFSRLLHVKPEFAEAHYNLAVALSQENRLEEAIEHLRDAIRVEPDYAEAHNELGVLLARGGKMQEAIVHFSKALEVKPDLQQAQKNLTRAHQQRNQEKGIQGF
jgi:tetratricopeptide (TPR) repeat protein